MVHIDNHNNELAGTWKGVGKKTGLLFPETGALSVSRTTAPQ